MMSNELLNVEKTKKIHVKTYKVALDITENNNLIPFMQRNLVFNFA